MKYKKKTGALVLWCSGTLSRKGFTPPLHARAGFTLLELLVVILIMGMVIAMSMPAFSAYLRGSRLRNASREISSAIMSARTQAITLRRERVVFFVEANRSFGIMGEEEGWVLPPGVRFSFTGGVPIDVMLTPTGRVDGAPPYTIIIFSDENNNGVMDGIPPAGEPRRTIRVGALGHVTIE